jgi:predicted HicB family RNase H-like nuclease
MNQAKYATRETPLYLENTKFVVRLPKDLHAQLAALAKRNRRSMNSEILLAIEQAVREPR